MSQPPGSPVEKSAVLKLFPTHVWATQFKPEVYGPVNRSVVACLEAMERADPGLAKAGQWQSGQDLHLRPEMAGLVQLIRGAVTGVCESLTLIYERFDITGCWANVSRTGYPHRAHTHPNNYLSGAWYVETAPGANTISFHDPRPQAGMIVPPARDQDRANSDRISLDVAEGMIVIFPAWLSHSVDPNMSDSRRISVAFNIMFPEFGERMARPLWQGDSG